MHVHLPVKINVPFTMECESVELSLSVTQYYSLSGNDANNTTSSTHDHDYVDNSLPDTVTNAAYGVSLQDRISKHDAGPLANVTLDQPSVIKLNEPADSVREPAPNKGSNRAVELKRNGAWQCSLTTLEEPVLTTTANLSYNNYPATTESSDTIEVENNEAYAMSITTRENEAYKPVVDDSGEGDDYDYVII